MTALGPERRGPERPGPEYPPEWDNEPETCPRGVTQAEHGRAGDEQCGCDWFRPGDSDGEP